MVIFISLYVLGTHASTWWRRNLRNVSCFGSQFSQILPRVPHYTLAFKIRHLDTLININVRGETFLRSGIANRFAMHNFQSFFFTKRQFDFFPLCLRTIRNPRIFTRHYSWQKLTLHRGHKWDNIFLLHSIRPDTSYDIAGPWPGPKRWYENFRY